MAVTDPIITLMICGSTILLPIDGKVTMTSFKWHSWLKLNLPERFTMLEIEKLVLPFLIKVPFVFYVFIAG